MTYVSAATVARSCCTTGAAGASARSRERRLPALAAFGAILALVAVASPALADDRLPELRIAQSFGGHFDVESVAVAWFGRTPSWTRASRFEYSAGIIRGADSSRLFAFAGPVWRASDRTRRLYTEFSFGPALLDGSRIDGRELGGSLHFRSALALGMRIGRHERGRIALRISHISNGGLAEPNPGIDFIGISLSVAQSK